MPPAVIQKQFGSIDKMPVTEYTISNANGMQVSVIGYGATITKIITHDKNGKADNITLGFDSIDGYAQNGNYYMGSIVGRYCNRIAHAKFSLYGTEYKLAANNGTNSLHGGMKGFDKVLWDVEIKNNQSLKLSYLSKDAEEGFPGNLKIEVVYTVTEKNELIIDYAASTDKATPVNFTSHCYFNLSGKGNILDHELKLYSDQFTKLNDDSIPTGELASVKNDRHDFSVVKKVGLDIESFPGGYDINFILKNASEKAAELFDPSSGRYMEMFTTEPGLQFYCGDFTYPGNNAATKYAALCLEAQHYPNSPNEPSFPNTVLQPGETYRQTTIYKFSTK